MALFADANGTDWTGCQRCRSTGTRFRHGVFVPCRQCQGRGIVNDDSPAFQPMQTPLVGIIGGGISGMALALALRHRNIPCIVFEKDVSLAISEQYLPTGSGTNSSTAFSASYAGVEGLTVSYGVGEGNSPSTDVDTSSLSATYAYGPITVGYSKTEYDSSAANSDKRFRNIEKSTSFSVFVF